MEIQNKYPSILRLKNLLVNKFSFKRNEIITKHEAPVEIQRNVIPVDDNSFKLELICSIGNESTEVYLNITMIGVFEYDSEITDEQKTRLANENAVAIIFPFLRSQVAILTSQPNMTPIVLPPMNIVAMLQEQSN